MKEGKEVVFVDPLYFRPTEVDLLIGDPTKAKTQLGWEPKYDLNSLVNDMMKGDLKLMKKEKYLQDGDLEYLIILSNVLSFRQMRNLIKMLRASA